jgi:hypothetical protein
VQFTNELYACPLSFVALIAKFHKPETIVPMKSEEETEESSEDYPNANKNPTITPKTYCSSTD